MPGPFSLAKGYCCDMGRPWGVGLAVMLFLCAGCERRFFWTRGAVASEGGRLGTWHLAPQACARGLTTAMGADRVQSVATLLWQDQRLRGKKYRDHAYERAGDLPLRLDLVQDDAEGKGLVAVLGMMKSGGMHLDGATCKRLQLESHEEGAAVEGGRPTLAGTLAMDCTLDGNHITADVQFNQCEW